MHSGRRRPQPREPGRTRDCDSDTRLFCCAEQDGSLAYFLKFLLQRHSNKQVKPPGSRCVSSLAHRPPQVRPPCRAAATQPRQGLWVRSSRRCCPAAGATTQLRLHSNYEAGLLRNRRPGPLLPTVLEPGPGSAHGKRPRPLPPDGPDQARGEGARGHTARGLWGWDSRPSPGRALFLTHPSSPSWDGPCGRTKGKECFSHSLPELKSTVGKHPGAFAPCASRLKRKPHAPSQGSPTRPDSVSLTPAVRPFHSPWWAEEIPGGALGVTRRRWSTDMGNPPGWGGGEGYLGAGCGGGEGPG